jgi:hypothetical protein
VHNHHLGLDGGRVLHQSMPFFEVVEGKLFPFGIPGDGFVKNA